MSLSSAEATVAYDESLAAVEYIQETYGMSDVQRILQRMGDGSTPEAALRAPYLLARTCDCGLQFPVPGVYSGAQRSLGSMPSPIRCKIRCTSLMP